MLSRILTIVTLLMVIMVAKNSAQTTQDTTIQSAEGSCVYAVSNDDHPDQWQDAFESPVWPSPDVWPDNLWSKLLQLNPRLEKPDVIEAGDTLLVPLSMAKAFHSVINATRTYKTSFIGWLSAIAFVIVVILISWYLSADRTRKKMSKKHALERGNTKLKTQSADPYFTEHRFPEELSLLTIPAVIDKLAHLYATERKRNLVATDLTLPPEVFIEKIKAINIKGTMNIGREYLGYQAKCFDYWIPAWECLLSNGTSNTFLMFSGQEVTERPDLGEQIRRQDRKDIPETRPHYQIWPVIESDLQPLTGVQPKTRNNNLPSYREVSVKSSERLLLYPHYGDKPDEVNIVSMRSIIKGLAVIDGEVIVQLRNGDDCPIANIDKNPPTQPLTNGSDDQA